MKKKVFIFEDEEMPYNRLKTFLEGIEYDVMPHEDLKQAIDEHNIKNYVEDLIKQNWDQGLRLIICDLKIRGINGYFGIDLIKDIRNDNRFLIPECPSFSMLIPIIAWTGNAEETAVIDSLRAGANDYSYKPSFTPENDISKREAEKLWECLKNKITNQVDVFERKFEHILSVPSEIQSDLKNFKSRYKGQRTAFIMTSFAQEHKERANKVKEILKSCNIMGLIADAPGGENSIKLWRNIKVFMHGCDFGIGLYADDSIIFNKEKEEEGERIIRINSNLTQEVGYMLGLQKEVYILKHKSLPQINSDLAEYIYIPFDDESSLEKTIKDFLKTKRLI